MRIIDSDYGLRSYDNYGWSSYLFVTVLQNKEE